MGEQQSKFIKLSALLIIQIFIVYNLQHIMAGNNREKRCQYQISDSSFNCLALNDSVWLLMGFDLFWRAVVFKGLAIMLN